MNKYSTPAKYFFRAAFPRGRLLTEIEDDLTIFAQFIVSFGYKPKEQFETAFDNAYKSIHYSSVKTIKNHRTEMTKLLGLTTVNNGFVEPSARTLSLVKNQDFRLFFKIFCKKFQFPNCINKSQETAKQIVAGVKFKPAKFILEILREGDKRFGSGFSVSGTEVSNLVFNDLRVLTGQMNAKDVLEMIVKLRKGRVQYDGGSYISQHGREFLGYMTLAGLLLCEDHSFSLNDREGDAIKEIVGDEYLFNIDESYISQVKARKDIQRQWELWYGSLDPADESRMATKMESYEYAVEAEKQAEPIKADRSAQPYFEGRKETGDIGEKIVLQYEQEQISKIRPDKIGLVRIVSNDTSLGFDIQSLEFHDVELKKLIEVKTTKRTFAPSNDEIITFFPMSSNEWSTAKLYKECYYIYRVFLAAKEAVIFVVKNPVAKETKGLIILEPSEYRVLFKNGVADEIITRNNP